MSIPKLKFLALFFVFFAVFWQITTSFYIKMSPAGRQDLPRAAGGVRLTPKKAFGFSRKRTVRPLAESFFRTVAKLPYALKKLAWGSVCAKRATGRICRLLGKNAASPVRAWAQKLASLPVFVALRRFAVATAHKTEWRSGTTQHPRVGKTV